MNSKIYQRYAQGRAKKSPLVRDCIRAFLIGGSICTLGEALRKFYGMTGLAEESAGTATSVTLIFITAMLTGLGVFDNIAKRAGGGTIVPITGFANAITSAAIDNKTEGFIMGVGAKIFTVAGPVIVYGLSAGVVYGVICWIIGLL
ncbi:MAG: stage V sporulation protein AC [Clostridia bacterium]|nr:stage V sporulation protein AC [Clostridia bacterium]